jgi:hypothetical protein
MDRWQGLTRLSGVGFLGRGDAISRRAGVAWMSGVDPQGPIHFKEDVLRVKRSRFTLVILSASLESLPGERSKARAQDDKARWSGI